MARPKGSKNRPKDQAAAKPKRPKKAKAAAAAPAQPSRASAEASGSHPFKKPTADQVKSLVKALVSRGNEARSITEGASELVAKAVETKHFDKKALMIAKGLFQMAKNRPEAFSVTLPHLLAYIDDLELVKVANDARGLDLDGNDDGDDGADDGTEQAGKPGLSIVPKGEEQVPSPNSAVA
jgi:hypothetical protein